jgi:hypothetical protein
VIGALNDFVHTRELPFEEFWEPLVWAMFGSGMVLLAIREHYIRGSTSVTSAVVSQLKAESMG